MFSVELENTSGCKKNKLSRKLSEDKRSYKEVLSKDDKKRIGTIDNNEFHSNVSVLSMNSIQYKFKKDSKNIEDNTDFMDEVLFKKRVCEEKIIYNSSKYRNGLNNINHFGNIINQIKLTNRIYAVERNIISNCCVKENITCAYRNKEFSAKAFDKSNNNKYKDEDRYIVRNNTNNSNIYVSNDLNNRTVNYYKDNVKNLLHYSLRNEIHKNKNLIKNRIHDLEKNILMNIKRCPNEIKKKIDETHFNSSTSYINYLHCTNSKVDNLFNFINRSYNNNLNINTNNKKELKDENMDKEEEDATSNRKKNDETNKNKENFEYINGNNENSTINKMDQIGINNLKYENGINLNYLNIKKGQNFDLHEKKRISICDLNNKNGLRAEKNKDNIINYLNFEKSNNYKKMNSNSQIILNKKKENINDEINIHLFLKKKNKENNENKKLCLSENFIVKEISSENSCNLNSERKKNNYSNSHNNISPFLINQDKIFNKSVYDGLIVENNKTKKYTNINAVNLLKNDVIFYKKKKYNIFKKNNNRNNKMLFIDNKNKKKNSLKEQILHLKNKLFFFDKCDAVFEEKEKKNNLKINENIVPNSNEQDIVSTIKKQNYVNLINNIDQTIKNEVCFKDGNNLIDKNIRKNSFISNEECEKEIEKIMCKNIFCEFNESNLLNIEENKNSNISFLKDIINSPVRSYDSYKSKLFKNKINNLEGMFFVKNNDSDNNFNKDNFLYISENNDKGNICGKYKDLYKENEKNIVNYKICSHDEIFNSIKSEVKEKETRKEEGIEIEEGAKKEEAEKEEENEKEGTGKEEEYEKEETGKCKKNNKESVKYNCMTCSSELYRENSDKIGSNDYTGKRVNNTIEESNYENKKTESNLLNNIKSSSLSHINKICTNQFFGKKMNNHGKIFIETENNKHKIAYNQNNSYHIFNKTCSENKVGNSTYNIDNNIINIKNNKDIINKNVRTSYDYNLKENNFHRNNKYFFMKRKTVHAYLNKTSNSYSDMPIKKFNINGDKKSVNYIFMSEGKKKEILYFLVKRENGNNSFNVNHNSQKLINNIDMNDIHTYNNNEISDHELNKNILKTEQFNSNKHSHIPLQGKSEKIIINYLDDANINHYSTDNLNGIIKKKLLNDNLVDHYCINHQNKVIINKNIKLHNKSDNENINNCSKNNLTNLSDNKKYCFTILINKGDSTCMNKINNFNDSELYKNYKKEKFSKLSSLYITENEQNNYQHKTINYNENLVDPHIEYLCNYENTLLENKDSHVNNESNFKLYHTNNIDNFKKYNFVNNENDLFNSERLRSYFFKGKDAFKNKFFKVKNEDNRFSFFKYFFNEKSKMNKEGIMNEDRNEKRNISKNVDEYISNNCEYLDKLIFNNKTKYLEKNKWKNNIKKYDDCIIDNNNSYRSNNMNNNNSNDIFNKNSNDTFNKNRDDINNNSNDINNDSNDINNNINDINNNSNDINNNSNDINNDSNDINNNNSNDIFNKNHNNAHEENNIIGTNNKTNSSTICNIIIDNKDDKIDKSDIKENKIIEKNKSNIFIVKTNSNSKIINDVKKSKWNNNLFNNISKNDDICMVKLEEDNKIIKDNEEKDEKKDSTVSDLRKEENTKIDIMLDNMVQKNILHKEQVIHNNSLYKNGNNDINEIKLINKDKKKDFSENKNFLLENFEKIAEKINLVLDETVEFFKENLYLHNGYGKVKVCLNNKRKLKKKKLKNWSCVYKINKIICKGAHGVVFSAWKSENINYFNQDFFEKNNSSKNKKNLLAKEDNEQKEFKIREYHEGDNEEEEDYDDDEDEDDNEDEDEDEDDDETEYWEEEKEEENENEEEKKKNEIEIEDVKEKVENGVNIIYNDKKEKKEKTIKVEKEEVKNIKKDGIEIKEGEKKYVEKNKNISKSENIEETEDDNDEDDYDEENLVSLKIINLNYLSKKNNIKKILKEVYFLKLCNHPNIVKYYESFFWPPSYLVIVCEFLSGGTLHDLYRKHGKISEDILVYIVEDILKALNYLHNECLYPIIHRDIKPTNIVLSKNGTAKLIDFGSCEKLSNKKSKEIVGTIYYIPPEILMKDNYNCSLDIWSLGITIYEIVMCSLPWKRNKNMNENIKNIINSSPKINIDDGFSKYLCYFVEKCLQKNPENRGNVKDLLNFKFLTKKRLIKKKPNSIYEIRDILKINNGKKKNNIFRNFLKNFLFFNDKNKKKKNKVSSSRSCEPEMFFQKLGKENLYFLEIKLKDENVRSLNNLNLDSSREKEDRNYSSNIIENKKENYNSFKLLENIEDITQHEK